MFTNEQIKMLRLRLNLIQTDIATVYGCSKQYVSNIENGIEQFYSEEKHKKYINSMYMAQKLKQKGELPKYEEEKNTKPNSKKK